MKKSKNGLKMVKSENSKDNKNRRFLGSLRESKSSQQEKEIYKLVLKEISSFNNLIKGHDKILHEIGNL
jgi:hypothetical protein